MTPTKIRNMRSGLGLTQQQLARLCHVAPETVSRWEHGRSRPKGASRHMLELQFEKLRREEA